ncbi:MAG TPA: hypothetical protein VJ385_08560, partial [Fibrobacteria bacterium]|nr:hypothetical protein [Fibrobacteria bacterium]
MNPPRRAVPLWLAFAAAAFSAPAWARADRRAPEDFHPYYLRSQFAGSQGLLSIGAGKAFLDGLIEPDLDYGYVPEWAGGVAVHTLSQTTTFSLFPKPVGRSGTVYPLLLGYSAMIAQGNHYFLYGRKYAGYYWPSALHFRLFAGAKFLREKEFLPR